jgi:hypothetical protein
MARPAMTTSPLSPAIAGLANAAPAYSVAEANDSTRRMFFRISLFLVFLLFSMLHQTLAGVVHANLYLMWVFGLPPLFGLVICGRFKRSLEGRPAFYWCAFAAWMILAAPFSYWKGASLSLIFDYLRTDLSILFIVAGLTLTWKECQIVMSTVAGGAVVDLLTARFFQDDSQGLGGRLGLQGGTVGNPNDFAGHLILALSFLLWVGLTSKSKFRRVAALIGVAIGVVLVLKTASRGAEVGLGIAMLVFFVLGTGRHKIALLALGPIALIGLLLFLPPETLMRLQSFASSSAAGADAEALESTMSRQYLLQKSLEYTLQFPIFGVGPGQFSAYEGSHNMIGTTTHGSWHDTHNSYTQASAECGIPGGLLFIGGAVSTILIFRRVFQQAKARTDCKDIQTAALCLLVGVSGFYVTIGFLNFAYFFYEPFLGGLAIAVARAAREEFRVRGSISPMMGVPISAAAPQWGRRVPPQVAPGALPGYGVPGNNPIARQQRRANSQPESRITSSR